MPIEAKQKVNDGWDFDVVQERLLRADGSNSPLYANVRTDTNDVLGYSTDRYGLVQNSDLLERAEAAFKGRGIGFSRKVYTTDNGAKLRASYDLSGDQFTTEVPEVGDVMGYRLIVQNSFDRTLRVSFALGLMRLVCTNGMQTMEKDIDMVSKHSTKLNLDDLLTDKALNNALASLKGSADVFGKLAQTSVTGDQGLNILQNLTKKKILSEKVRERVAMIWNSPKEMLRTNNTDHNLYNLYNSVTQHLTDEVEDTRFEYANRISSNVLKNFEAAARNTKRFDKLITAPKVEDQVAVTA